MRFAGEYLPLARHSFRVLVGCWLLVAVVLVNSYSCIVVSSLMVPTVHPAINSLENLAASNDVSLIIRKDYALGQQILAIINKICIFHIFFYSWYVINFRVQIPEYLRRLVIKFDSIQTEYYPLPPKRYKNLKLDVTRFHMYVCICYMLNTVQYLYRIIIKTIKGFEYC